MSKPKYWRDHIYYTDYPFTKHPDTGDWVQGVTRRLRVLSYDGNKYAMVQLLDQPGGVHEIKIGYVHPDEHLLKHVGWRTLAKMEGIHHAQIKARVRKTSFFAWSEKAPEGKTSHNGNFGTIKELNQAVIRWVREGHHVVAGLDEEKRYRGGYESLTDPRWRSVPQERKSYRKRNSKPGPKWRTFVTPL